MDESGNIYGTTLFGGHGNCQSGCGTVFRLDTAGKLQVAYQFTGGADGSQPFGPLVRDADGSLYEWRRQAETWLARRSRESVAGPYSS